MLIQLVILFILISINAFFTASETAFISLSDNKIKAMAESGNKRAILLRKLLSEPGNFLATTQMSITLAGFLTSAFASESFADRLVDAAIGMGFLLSPMLLKSLAIIVITLLLSYISFIFGILVPKKIAGQKSEQIAMLAIRPIVLLSKISLPFAKFTTYSSDIVFRLLGGDPNAAVEQITEEEIRMMVDAGEEKGTIQEIEKKIINNVFDFDDKIALDIMTHRTEIVGIDINAKLQDIVTLVDMEKYSRIPVYEDSIDDIIGILHTKDLISFLSNGPMEAFDLQKLIRKPYFVPESKKIDDLFVELQKNKTHMAVVIDEYGGTAGIITIEDLLEEIVGNIFDEYDEEEPEYEQLDENTYLFDGSISLDEVEEILKVDIPFEEYETLSGYLIGQLGRLPMVDENPIVELDNIVFKIEKAEEKKILKVKVCIA